MSDQLNTQQTEGAYTAPSLSEVSEAVVALNLPELITIAAKVHDLIRERQDQMPSLFSLLPGCHLCYGTGRIGNGYCMCEEGQEARRSAAAKEPDPDYSDFPLFAALG